MVRVRVNSGIIGIPGIPGIPGIAQDFLDSGISMEVYTSFTTVCREASHVDLPLIPSRRLLPVCPVEMDSSDSVSRNLGMLKIRFYL